MKVTITQLRKANADPNLPQWIHNAYGEDHLDEMFVSEPGYEIAAVYLMPDTAAVPVGTVKS